MKFTLTARLAPSGSFGVPQDNHTVVPPSEPGREMHGPTFDVLLGKMVGHGSMSVYRTDEEAIREHLTVDGFELEVRDNYVFVKVEAGSGGDALRQLTEFLDRFLMQLSVRLRRSFTYDVLGLTDDEGRNYTVPESLSLVNATVYNLDQVRKAIRDAADASSLLDERLDRASQYFEHAIFLYERRHMLAESTSRHFTALISAVFLSLAKAVTIIVGDPSGDSDHQRRYKEIGLDYDFYKNKIKRVLELRNNYDVAHHDLTGQAAEVIEQNYGEALETAATILAQYSDHRKSTNDEVEPS